MRHSQPRSSVSAWASSSMSASARGRQAAARRALRGHRRAESRSATRADERDPEPGGAADGRRRRIRGARPRAADVPGVKLPAGRGFAGRSEMQVRWSATIQAASRQRLLPRGSGCGSTSGTRARLRSAAAGRGPARRDAGSRAAAEAVIGLGDESLEPVSTVLDEGHFLIAGPRRSGRSTALGDDRPLAPRSNAFARAAPRRSEAQPAAVRGDLVVGRVGPAGIRGPAFDWPSASLPGRPGAKSPSSSSSTTAANWPTERPGQRSR